MNSFIMYQLEGVRDDNTVSKIFAKFCPEGVDKFAGNVFLSAKSAPDFCKLIGFSFNKDTSGLEQLATMMTQSDYNKKIDKFEHKSNKLQAKIINAQKAAKTSDNRVELGGQMSAQSVKEILTIAERQQKELEENSKVTKAKDKFDKFIDKNQALQEASKYTTTGKNAGGLISWGAGTESKEKNIYETIEEAKKPQAGFIEDSMANLKNFLNELLNVVSKVGIMSITDGNKTPNSNNRKNTRIDLLSASELMAAKNREIIYITK